MRRGLYLRWLSTSGFPLPLAVIGARPFLVRLFNLASAHLLIDNNITIPVGFTSEVNMSQFLFRLAEQAEVSANDSTREPTREARLGGGDKPASAIATNHPTSCDV